MGHFVGSQMKSEHKVTAVVTSTHAAWMWAWWYFLTHFFSKEHYMIIQEQQKLSWIFCHNFIEVIPQWKCTFVFQNTKVIICNFSWLSVKIRHVCSETEIENVLFFPPMFMYCNRLNTSPAWAAPAWRNEVMFQRFLLLSSLIHRLTYHRCSGSYLFTYSTYTMSAWISCDCLSSTVLETFGIVHNSTTYTTRVQSFLDFYSRILIYFTFCYSTFSQQIKIKFRSIIRFESILTRKWKTT